MIMVTAVSTVLMPITGLVAAILYQTSFTHRLPTTSTTVAAAGLDANPAWTSPSGAAHRVVLAGVLWRFAFPRVTCGSVSSKWFALRKKCDEKSNCEERQNPDDFW